MSWARLKLQWRKSDPPLSFDFTLSFNSRQICIHSWFYWYNFMHCAINL